MCTYRDVIGDHHHHLKARDHHLLFLVGYHTGTSRLHCGSLVALAADLLCCHARRNPGRGKRDLFTTGFFKFSRIMLRLQSRQINPCSCRTRRALHASVTVCSVKVVTRDTALASARPTALRGSHASYFSGHSVPELTGSSGRQPACTPATPYYQTEAQVSLQETGSEPLGLGPSSSVRSRK